MCVVVAVPVLCKKLSRSRVGFTFIGDIRDEEVHQSNAQWLENMQQADAEGRQLVLLVDGRESNGMSAGQRKVTVDFAEQHDALIRRVCAGQALVLSSAIQRGVLTAILWIKPPATLMKTFGTLEDAERFLDEIESNPTRRLL